MYKIVFHFCKFKMTSHIPYDFSEPWYSELYYLISEHLGAFPNILLTSNLIHCGQRTILKFIKIYFYGPAYGLHW